MRRLEPWPFPARRVTPAAKKALIAVRLPCSPRIHPPCRPCAAAAPAMANIPALFIVLREALTRPRTGSIT